MSRKPHDCRCLYPRVVSGDVTGHASDCPAFHRIRANVLVRNDPPAEPARSGPVDSPRLRIHPPTLYLTDRS